MQSKFQFQFIRESKECGRLRKRIHGSSMGSFFFRRDEGRPVRIEALSEADTF